MAHARVHPLFHPALVALLGMGCTDDVAPPVDTSSTGTSAESSTSETPSPTATTEVTATTTSDAASSSSTGPGASEDSSSSSWSSPGSSSSDGTGTTDAASSSSGSGGASSSDTDTASSTSSNTGTDDASASATGSTGASSEGSSSDATTEATEGSTGSEGGGPVCGDGIVDATEACDDGPANGDGNSTCTAACTIDICGDGYLHVSEACDDGPANGDGESTCTAACTIDVCGDGYLHVSELCDDGPANGDGQSACTSDCELNSCGDLYVHAPTEGCDEGPFETATCDADCSAVTCGDGVVNDVAGEQCDDGDLDDLDACTNACFRGYVELTVGDGHACARGPAGNMRCWGVNGFGRLGYGNNNSIGDNELPASAGDIDLGGVAAQISAGTWSTCAVLDDQALRCWGYGLAGQLGYGNTNNVGDNETPASAGDVPVGEDVLQIAVGGQHACALVGIGVVRCWGDAAFGQLGYGNTNDIGDNEAASTAGIVDVGALATQIAAGEEHTCALLNDGAVRCWGRFDAIGYPGLVGNVGDSEVPDDVGDVDVGGTVVQLALGARHTCVRLDTGAVRCWGRGGNGRLGYGNTNDVGIVGAPALAGDIDLGGLAVDIAAGRWHTCAVLAGGAVRCWGFGGTGALGYGNTNDIGDGETPSWAGDVDVGGTVIDVDAGDQYTCALLEDHRVKCWGNGDFGVLGYGNTTDIGDNETPASIEPLEL